MPGLSPYLPFTKRFEAAEIRYAVAGGVAAILYGEPRLTLDLDVLLELSIKQIDRFLAAFPEEEFYVPPREVIHAEISRGHRGHLNLYEHSSGIRADIYLRSRDPLDTWSLENSVRLAVDGDTLVVVPPEAVIVRKLEYLREGGGDRHVRDIRTILAMQRPLAHQAPMEQWIRERQLEREWSMILKDLE